MRLESDFDFKQVYFIPELTIITTRLVIGLARTTEKMRTRWHARVGGSEYSRQCGGGLLDILGLLGHSANLSLGPVGEEGRRCAGGKLKELEQGLSSVGLGPRSRGELEGNERIR